jgi:hypothetical protein
MNDASEPSMGQFYSARLNWLESSVRDEIASQLAVMRLDHLLTGSQIDGLATGITAELDYRWRIEPKGEIPPGFEPPKP